VKIFVEHPGKFAQRPGMTFAEHQAAASRSRWENTPKKKRAELARKAGLASGRARKKKAKK